MHVIEEFLPQPVAPWYCVFIFYILHPKEEKMPPTDLYTVLFTQPLISM